MIYTSHEFTCSKCGADVPVCLEILDTSGMVPRVSAVCDECGQRFVVTATAYVSIEEVEL